MAKESAWAPFSKNLRMQSMAFVNEVLRRCGATFRNPAASANNGRRTKLPRAQDKDDIANRRFLYDLAAFFSRAAEHGGLEVW